jgi:quercetin dioxygenase-like cupin family protein
MSDENALWFDSLHGLLPDAPLESIISRTLLKNGHANVTLFSFDAGQSLSEHSAGQAAILQIVDGEAEIKLGDEVHAAQAGSWAYMPPRLPHAITAKTNLTMLLILLKD